MDGRPTWTDCDEAGDHVVSNVLSPRHLVCRPDNMDETVPHTFFFSDVARECFQTKVKTECKGGEQQGIKGTICYCDKDLCNGSDVIKVTMTTGFIVLVALLINIL